MLLAGVLRIPHDPDAQGDLKLVGLLARWVVRLTDDDSYELTNLQTACSAMVRITESAISRFGGVPMIQRIGEQQPGAAHTEFTVSPKTWSNFVC